MSDIAKQNYELAYHITSNLEESDVQKTWQDLEKIITSHGGGISFSKDPEKFRLGYPIKHQLNSYFGYFNFSLDEPESINTIRDELKMNANLLRFLILKHKVQPKADKEDLVRKLAMAERRRIRATKQTDKSLGSKSEPSKMDEKVLDEKLEEIIDKL